MFFSSAVIPGEAVRRIGELNKEATNLKRKGDLEGAVNRAAEAFDIRKQYMAGIEPEPWTKYPLYLQSAGNVAQAIAVFDWLIEHAEAIVSNADEVQGQPPFFVNMMVVRFLTVIHDKARLCCQRSGMTEDAGKHAIAAETLSAEEERLAAMVELHRERERKRKQNRLEQLKKGEISFAEFTARLERKDCA